MVDRSDLLNDYVRIIDELRAENFRQRRRLDVAATMHHASQGEGCPICKTEERCRTRAVLEGE